MLLIFLKKLAKKKREDNMSMVKMCYDHVSRLLSHPLDKNSKNSNDNMIIVIVVIKTMILNCK